MIRSENCNHPNIRYCWVNKSEPRRIRLCMTCGEEWPDEKEPASHRLDASVPQQDAGEA